MNYNNIIFKNKIVKKYEHLTLKDRMNIYNMFNSNIDKFTLENISNKIGVDKATINREICRNGTLRAYSGRFNKSIYRAETKNC